MHMLREFSRIAAMQPPGEAFQIHQLVPRFHKIKQGHETKNRSNDLYFPGRRKTVSSIKNKGIKARKSKSENPKTGHPRHRRHPPNKPIWNSLDLFIN
jgi:hypothetical protein